MRRLTISLLFGIVVVMTLPSVTVAADPCRVRNVDQGTTGGSLKAMAVAAGDGETLRVRGLCRGEIVVSDDLTIRGVGDAPAVTGQGERRVFRITSGADVTIRDLVIRSGLAPDASLRGGGGVRNHGDLTIIDSVIRDDRAGPKGLGGGILNIGDLVVFDSLIRENRAFRGGGIDTREITGADPTPTLSIGGTRIVRNRGGNGGGIHNMGDAFIQFSEVDRNRAGFGGGGIANVQTGKFEITNTIIRNNTAGVEGGGVANYDGGVVTFLGVNFSGNDPDDCFGTPPC